MQLKLNDKVTAAVETNEGVIINLENSQVFENIETNEGYIYIKSTVNDKFIKIRFVSKGIEVKEQETEIL